MLDGDDRRVQLPAWFGIGGARLLLAIGALLPAAFVGVGGPLPARAQSPAAIVEETGSQSAAVRPLEFLNPGREIQLLADEVLVLGYLRSCLHETITGGRVTVGETESHVAGGFVEREVVECHGGRADLSLQEASKSGGLPVRAGASDGDEPEVVFSTMPVFVFPEQIGRLVITPRDLGSDRASYAVDGRDLDLAALNVRLSPGKLYEARVGQAVRLFKVAPSAMAKKDKIVGRLVRF